MDLLIRNRIKSFINSKKYINMVYSIMFSESFTFQPSKADLENVLFYFQ